MVKVFPHPHLEETTANTSVRRTRQHDPFSRRKRYVMFFEFIGLIWGYLVFSIALGVQRSKTFELITEQSDNHDLEIDKIVM